MPVIIPPTYAEIIFRLQHSAVTKEWTYTLGYGVETGINDMQSALDAIDAAWLNRFETPTDTNAEMLPSRAYWRDGTGNLHLLEATRGSIGGANSGEFPPPQVAMVATKRCSVVGKKFRGRCYVPSQVTESAINEGGRIDSTLLAERQGRWDNFLDDVNAAGNGAAVLLHSDSTSPTPIVAFQLRTIVRTQRRRLPRN